MREGPLPRLCIRCTRRTQTAIRIVGGERFVAARLTALGLPKARAAKIARSATGTDRRDLNVSICRSCARGVGLKAGNPAPTIAEQAAPPAIGPKPGRKARAFRAALSDNDVGGSA